MNRKSEISRKYYKEARWNQALSFINLVVLTYCYVMFVRFFIAGRSREAMFFPIVLPFFVISLFLLNRWTKSLWTRIHNLLYANIDLVEYYNFFDLFLKESKRGSLNFYGGIREYCHGNFDQAQKRLGQVQKKDLLLVNRKLALQQVYLYRLLTEIARQNDSSYAEVLAEGEANNIFKIKQVGEKTELYRRIASGEVVEDIPLIMDNHLFRIINTYYCAKNALNAGDVDQAWELFESIKDENSELFMVQEARAYLGIVGK